MGKESGHNLRFNLFDFLFVPAYTNEYGYHIQKKKKEAEKETWLFGPL
jgi:hypothetical protein